MSTETIIGVFLLLMGMVNFFGKFGKQWIFHLVVNLVIYLFYCFLWIMILIPKNPSLHHGDSGLGFGLFTLLTSPFYIIYNVFSIVYSRKILNKRIGLINSIGLTMCFLHIIIFYFLTNVL